METGQQLWRQFVIAGVANIAIAATGYSIGWSCPVSIKLKDANLTDSPLPKAVTDNQEAWIESILPLGAIFGSLIAGPLAARIGRKWALLASSIPLLVGWIPISTASSLTILYSGRLLCGVSIGMTFTVSPMYCAEIATNDCRGALDSYLQMGTATGYVLVYSIGPLISYGAIAYVGIATVILFEILFFFMPETPIYHLTKNDRETAAHCLMMLRGQSRAGVEAELALMASDVAASMAKTVTIYDMFRGNNFKTFYISGTMVFFQQFCGVNAVLFYMSNIFEEGGTDLYSSVATIIVGFVKMGSSCVTPFVVDRLGRRLLLLFSACGTTVGLAFLGMYFLLHALQSPVVNSIRYLPIISLMVFVVTYCVGLGPLPWAVMSELLPTEVKEAAAPIATAFCWALSFLVTQFLGPISEAVGMYLAFWFFSVCCVVAFFFTFLVVPETHAPKEKV